MMISVSTGAENIVGKAENVGFHNFLRFPQCFQKFMSSGNSFYALQNSHCGLSVFRFWSDNT